MTDHECKPIQMIDTYMCACGHNILELSVSVEEGDTTTVFQLSTTGQEVHVFFVAGELHTECICEPIGTGAEGAQAVFFL